MGRLFCFFGFLGGLLIPRALLYEDIFIDLLNIRVRGNLVLHVRKKKSLEVE